MKRPNSVDRVIYVCMGCVVACCLALSVQADERAGVQATGYLTHTSFQSSGTPTFKQVMMFEAHVSGEKWHIRTEPVHEGESGVRYYETYGTNDSVCKITALETASSQQESPFKELRAKLKELKAEDVYFQSKSPNRSGPTPQFPVSVNQITNVAVATTTAGRFPVADPSYAAFLWFAFTPLLERSDGTNRMLLQIWDDGNSASHRFRYARWQQYSEPPHSIVSADFGWKGKELRRDGSLVDISISDVSEPQEMAAQYFCEGTTNFGGRLLPLHFSLTRYKAKRPMGKQQIASTTVAAVTGIKKITNDGRFEVRVPGKTVVTDYRLSAEELKGVPLRYLIDSNAPPDLSTLKQGKAYRAALATARGITPSGHIRWPYVVIIIFSPLIVIFFLYRKSRNERSHTIKQP